MIKTGVCSVKDLKSLREINVIAKGVQYSKPIDQMNTDELRDFDHHLAHKLMERVYQRYQEEVNSPEVHQFIKECLTTSSSEKEVLFRLLGTRREGQFNSTKIHNTVGTVGVETFDHLTDNDWKRLNQLLT
jgi:hypothetical protein